MYDFLHKSMKIIGIVAIASFLSGMFVSYLFRIQKNDTAARIFADSILSSCVSRSYKPACYDKEIPKLMRSPHFFSMEKAFEVTAYIQKKDPSYLYCHVLGHKLAEEEVARNPDRWKDVVTRCPAMMCNNGCAHGALMKRFQSEYLTDAQIDAIKNDLFTVCEPRGNWYPSFVERSMCYHSLGHLFMYITRAQIDKSAALCGLAGQNRDDGTYTQTCTEGVFMSVYQPLEPEDKALIRDIEPKSQAQSVVFCNRYSGDVRGACMRESWPLWSNEIMSPSGALAFCKLNEGYLPQKRCIGTVMNFITVRLIVDNNLSLSTFTDYCSGLSLEWQGECYARGAGRLMQIDPAFIDLSFALCDKAQVNGVGDLCYKEMLSIKTKNFSGANRQQEGYCLRFPERYKKSCDQSDTD
jgi:hypothetical protein